MEVEGPDEITSAPFVLLDKSVVDLFGLLDV